MLVELRHASTSYGILASPGRRVRTRATRVPARRRGVEVCALCALSPRIGRFGVFDCGPQSGGPSARGIVERLADALGRSDRRESRRRRDTRQVIVPYGQSGVEMAGFDEGAAIEGGVDGAEAQNLRFPAAGGSTV